MILSMLSNRRSTVVRVVLVVVALLVWLGIGSVGGMAQGKLSQVQTNDAAAFLPSSAESTRAAEESKAFVDTATLPALIVLQPADGSEITPAQLAAVQAYAAGVPDQALPAGNDGTWSDYLVAAPAVVPSEDGQAVLVAFSLDAAKAEGLLADDEGVTASFVTAVRASLDDQLGATATSAGDLGLQAWVTGPAGFVADLITAFGGIDGVLLLVALGAVLLILVLVYKSPFLPFVVIFTAVFALSLAGLVVYQLAKNGTLVLNGQSQGILSILVVGASVDYALLLVSRYREELGQVEHPAEAMKRALRVCVEPIAASAGTVIAGVLCLLLSDLGSNRSLGPVAAIGIASALLAALTLLPALLLIAGKRSRVLFWPRAPRPHAAVPVDVDQAHLDPAAAPDPADGPGRWARLARFVGRHARPVWVITALALCVGAAFLPTLKASGTNQVDIFLTDVDAVAGEQVLVDHFPAGAVQPAIVIVDEADVDAVTAAAKGSREWTPSRPTPEQPAAPRRPTLRRSSWTVGCGWTSRRPPRLTRRRRSTPSGTCGRLCTRPARPRWSGGPRPRRWTRRSPAPGT